MDSYYTVSYRSPKYLHESYYTVHACSRCYSGTRRRSQTIEGVETTFSESTLLALPATGLLARVPHNLARHLLSSAHYPARHERRRPAAPYSSSSGRLPPQVMSLFLVGSAEPALSGPPYWSEAVYRFGWISMPPGPVPPTVLVPYSLPLCCGVNVSPPWPTALSWLSLLIGLSHCPPVLGLSSRMPFLCSRVVLLPISM